MTTTISSAITIVKEGKPASAIIFSERPTRSAQVATEELAANLRMISGASTPILKER